MKTPLMAMRVGAAIENESLILDGGDARASCGTAAGDFFHRLRRETIRLGGSFDSCPFAHDYAGPVIRWSDEGWPYMHSSRQKEMFHEGPLQG